MRGKDLSERIYKLMKTDLMLGHLKSDEMFNEQTLADRYGCSRTPVREAAGRLVIEGYLNKYPSKGYIIRVPSENEVRELRECRYVLECSVIDKLTANASDEQIRALGCLPAGAPDDVLYSNNLQFHMEMARLAGNEKMAEMIESLLYLLVRPLVSSRYSSFGDYAGRVQDSGAPLTPEHAAIIDALLARDAVRAKALLKDDIYPAKY